VVVLERTGVAEAFSRSRMLVRGRGMTVFGTLFMAGILMLVPVFVIVLAVQSLVTSPLTDGLVTGVVAGGLTTPFVALCLVTLYADLRSRFAQPASRFGA
jgi:nitrate reductase gamma subunit